jgi:hypothetical protein
VTNRDVDYLRALRKSSKVPFSLLLRTIKRSDAYQGGSSGIAEGKVELSDINLQNRLSMTLQGVPPMRKRRRPYSL